MYSYSNQMTIYGPDNQRKVFTWEENYTTLRSLLNHVVQVFALENLDRTRIHLFHHSDEIDLLTKSNSTLTSLNFLNGTSVDVKIIPPLTSEIDHSGDIIVQCSHLNEQFNIKVSYLDLLNEVKEKIQKHLKNRRIHRIDLYDKDHQPISDKNSLYLLSQIGIKQGDRIYAYIHFDSSSISSTSEQNSTTSSTTNVQDEKKVYVMISRLGHSAKQFRIRSDQTVKQLIDKIEEHSPFESAAQLHIEHRSKPINIIFNSKRLSDLGVEHDGIISVQITDKKTSTISTNDSISSSTSKPIGLSNIGNTCFMNSALQCLAHVKPLTDFCLEKFLLTNSDNNSISTDQSNSFDTESSLTNAYAQLLKTIWLTSQTTTRSYSSLFRETSHRPYDIKEIIGNLAPRFATYEQQDAQEFMTFFLDRLHKEFKDSTTMDKQSKKIIKDLFYGKLYSTITCLKCQNQYRTTNSFNLLSLPLNVHERIFSIRFVGRDGLNDSTIVQIQNHLQVKHLIRNYMKQSTKYFYEITVMANNEPVDYETPLTNILTNELFLYEGEDWAKLAPYDTFSNETRRIRLDECLEEFFSEEHLDDLIECENHCRERTAAKKQFQLESLPPILIIQLKRFSHENGYKSKIETFVDYPVENLDLNRFVRSQSTRKENENNVYDLFAVSNHMGSIHFGHYTAFARRGNQWYKFDDSYVSSVFIGSDVVTRDAYLLFYIRQGYKN